MVVRGKVERPLPSIIFYIKQESSLKLLAVYFHSDPINWDQQFDNLLSKAGRRMHILRVCKKYGYSLDYLHYLFHRLIISLFTYGISVWGTATYNKYLSRIDKFQKRAVRFGFLKKVTPAANLLETSNRKLWKGITYHPVKLGHLAIEVIPIYSHRLELNVVLLIDVFLTLFIFHRHLHKVLPCKFVLFSCYSKRLFLKSAKSFIIIIIIIIIMMMMTTMVIVIPPLYKIL